MRYVFVGDIHGKRDQVERALDMDGMKVFVGDFIDSFDRNLDDHRECYIQVLAAIDKGEAMAVFGNHELSYMMPNFHRCSGFDRNREMVVKEFETQIWAKFKPYIFLTPEFLVTHAGLTNHWVDGMPIPEVEPWLEDQWEHRREAIHAIGRSRGGIQRWGGIFWCHYPNEFQAIPGLSQVFGHTRGKDIRQQDNNYCIDCLDMKHQFLEMDI